MELHNPRYHVGLQVESVALKGKSLPRVAALVEAMFIAELRHGILTAGHDLGALTPPITLGWEPAARHSRWRTGSRRA